LNTRGIEIGLGAANLSQIEFKVENVPELQHTKELMAQRWYFD
jgi:hypothetical protein